METNTFGAVYEHVAWLSKRISFHTSEDEVICAYDLDRSVNLSLSNTSFRYLKMSRSVNDDDAMPQGEHERLKP